MSRQHPLWTKAGTDAPQHARSRAIGINPIQVGNHRRGRLSVLISLIVAVAENGVIGATDSNGGGGLPWRLSSDLKTFRRRTMGKPVIMGRRTFQTLKKPLDGRHNIVVTRDPFFEAAGVSVVNSFADGLTLARVLARTNGADEVMIIGGEDIYRAALPHADRIYLTRVHAQPEGDRRFPDLDPAEWREASSEPLPKGDRDDHAATLRVLERIEGRPEKPELPAAVK